MTWFACQQPRPDAPVQLFCLPYAGGGAAAFRHWQAGLGPEVEVLAVRLPGRESRIAEDPRFEVAEVAGAIAERADRTFAIYGHSMGGRLAFDVVRELRATGRRLPARLYVGAARAPHVSTPSSFDGLATAGDDELVRRLADGGVLPGQVLADPELLRLLLPLLRADFTRVDSYAYQPGEPLPVPIVAFHGGADAGVSRQQMREWARHTSAGFSLHELDAGHLFLDEVRPRLLDLIRTDLLRPESPRTGGQPVGYPAHRFPLGRTGWSVWRDAVLRTAGFPASGLLALSAPGAAAAADAHLAGAAPECFDREFAAAVRAGAGTLREIAADPLVREAITWQNPEMMVAVDAVAGAAVDAPRNSRYRERERSLLMYWQRYCGKNETVGFFGPGCWVRLDPDAPGTVAATPGAALTRRRRVYFESWALAAFADALGRDGAVRRWWSPVLRPQLSLRGRLLLRPGRQPVELPAVEAALLAGCDGTRTAAALVTDPAIGLHRPDDGYMLLERFVQRNLIYWDADLPVSPRAEQVLRERLAGIGDPAVRARATAGLDRLCAARDTVAASAGDPAALRGALSDLDETFTGLTGLPPRRRPGQAYGGRRLCYEDTSRDLDVLIGTGLIDGIAAPLAVLLRAARWLCGALERAYGDALRELYHELASGTPGRAVSLADLWFLAQGLFWADPRSGPAAATAGRPARPVDEIAAEFTRRWARLFGLDALPAGTAEITLSTADIESAAAQAFPAGDAAGAAVWTAARLHSPDLHICATDLAALGRGEYTVVLGELHAAWASFDIEVLTWSHPDPARLRDALAADLGGGRIRLLYPLDWPRRTSRVAESLAALTDRVLAFAAAPGADRSRLLRTVDLTLSEQDGEVMAIAGDGNRWPLVEVFSGLLAVHAVDAFKLVAAAPYTPRITLDRLVVARRTWRTTAGGCGLAQVSGEQHRYLAVRRWRGLLDLPERVYVKLGTETKPFFADLTSPHYATLLCSAVRAAWVTHGDQVPVVVSEALPGPEQAWVPDAAGRRYLSELRLHLVDERAGRETGEAGQENGEAGKAGKADQRTDREAGAGDGQRTDREAGEPAAAVDPVRVLR